MGQQQLLLLVLGIVIVGLAVVVGIQAFAENAKKANADALVNDAIRIASDAQAWKLKPEAFGGGAQSDWTAMTYPKIGYEEASANVYENLNGSFTLATQAGQFTITAASPASSNHGNTVVVTVTGTDPGQISTQVNPATTTGA